MLYKKGRDIGMQGKIEKEGKYELFETSKGHQILQLNDRDFFAVVEGNYGDLLVRSDAGHEKNKVMKKGKFYLVDFNNDPEFRDIPHLFLQDGRKYLEWVLPNNVPTSKDQKKKLIRTGRSVNKATVEFHVKGKGDKETQKQYKGTRKEARSKQEASGKQRSALKRGDLVKMSRQELYDLARKKAIEGRSKMNKDALLKALN